MPQTFCLMCGRPIPKERAKTLPGTTSCAKCSREVKKLWTPDGPDPSELVKSVHAPEREK